MKIKAVGLAFMVAAGMALYQTPASAASGPEGIQAQIDVQLRDFPGGVQSGAKEVSYQDGDVRLTFVPASGSAADTCTSGWYCFYDGPDFTGRKLSFQDCGGNQSLTDYGFGNKTSSWSNTTKHTVEVYDRDVSPFVTLWREAPGAASSNVGTAAYNKADFFYTYCGS